MGIWEKIRRFLIFWLAVALILLVVSIVTYWPELRAAVSNEFSAIVSGISTVVIIVVIIISVLS